MKYRFMDESRQEFEVKTMCHALSVSESGYYPWKQRGPSRHERADQRLIEQIQQAYQQGRQVYGSPRVHAELRAQGIRCGKNRVARLMRQAGLRAIHKRRRTVTTDSQHPLPVAPNLLQRDFTAPAPNIRWLTDITAIWTAEGSAGKRRLRSRPGEPCARKRASTGSGEGGWKRTCKGNALAAYPTVGRAEAVE
jgi:putative transposase